MTTTPHCFEIKHRSREHASVIGPLKTALGSKKHLDLQTKKIYSDALADSKLWHNAATWLRMSDQQHSCLDRHIMKRIAPMSSIKWSANDQRSSYAAVCAKVEEPLSILRLIGAGLRYLSRVIRFATPQLLASAQATAQSPDG